MEGFGSHGFFRFGLTTYGTTKYAIAYLAQSIAQEYKSTNVGVHRLYPGLTLTDFITKGKDKVNPEMAKTLNIIGDTPENVAKNLVPQMLNIEGNNKHLEHVSQAAYAFRFMTAAFRSNKFFDKDGNYIKK